MADPTNPQDKPAALAPTESPGEPERQWMTADDYNKAQTAREKRFEKSLTKSVEETVARILAEREATKEPADKDPAQAEKDSEIAALKKRLDAAEAARKEEASAREAERQARVKDGEREALTRGLRSLGITDEDMVEAAHSMLYDRRRVVVTDPAKGVCYKVVDRFGNEDLVPLDEGLKVWAGTAQGKKFLPPIGAEGSGARPRAGSAPGGDGKASKTDLINTIARLSGQKVG